MKNLIILFCFMVFAWQNTVAQTDNAYEGIVIFKIENLTDNLHSEMQNAIAKRTDLNIEYVCVQSDIVVVKYYGISFSNKTDVALSIKEKFVKVISPKEMQVIFVDVKRQQGNSKC